jgi:tetratricopeptide (TPR) repeat protein
MNHFHLTRFIITLSVGVLLLVWSGCSAESPGKIPITTTSQEALKDFMIGRDLFDKLRGQESLQHFQNAIQKDANFAMAYLFNSFSQPTIKGFFDQLDKAVALKDKVSEGERMWIEAVRAGADGFPMKQREIYQKLVVDYPNDERAYTLLGNNYFGTQEYEKAIEQYKKSIAINPDFSQPYNQMGYAYRFLEQFDEAESAFKRYVELIPDDPNPYDSYAELLMKIGKYDESIEQYQKALKVNPNFVASHIGIATNYNFKGEYGKARDQLKKLFEIARDDGEKRAARFAMTVSYVDEGNMDKALEELQWQFELGKKNNDAPNMTGDLTSMGNILCEMGKYDDALVKFEKALAVTNQSNLGEDVKEITRRVYLYNNARVALMKKDLQKAKTDAAALMEQAKAADNTFQIWLAHEISGRIAMYEKDYEKAIADLQLANLQNPYNLYRLAKIYKEKGDTKMAKDFCKRAANHNTLNSLQYAFMRHKAKEMLKTM